MHAPTREAAEALALGAVACRLRLQGYRWGAIAAALDLDTATVKTFATAALLHDAWQTPSTRLADVVGHSGSGNLSTMQDSPPGSLCGNAGDTMVTPEA